MNIEQLAIEHGILSKVESLGKYAKHPYMVKERQGKVAKLEGFAKAYAQQPSEPVGFVGGGFEEQIKLGNLIAVSSEPYAHLTRAIFTQPPNTVSLGQYNKLLDALKSVKSKTSDLHSNENATHLINRLLEVRHTVDFTIVEAERDDNE